MTILSQSHGFLFVHIPYCGGEYVKAAYQPYARWCDLILGGTTLGKAVESAYQQRYGIGQYATLKQLEKALGDDLQRFERVALVRHPETRLELMHQEACNAMFAFSQSEAISFEEARARVRQRQAPEELLLRTPILALARANDDNEWVRKVLELSATVGGVSLLSQLHWLKATSGITVERLFHWETVAEIWPYLERRIGTPIPAQTMAPELGSAQLVISTESRRMLHDALKADYRELGYALERSTEMAAPAFQF